MGSIEGSVGCLKIVAQFINSSSGMAIDDPNGAATRPPDDTYKSHVGDLGWITGKGWWWFELNRDLAILSEPDNLKAKGKQEIKY